MGSKIIVDSYLVDDLGIQCTTLERMKIEKNGDFLISI